MVASLCSLNGFDIVDANAVFSMDDCCFFPQCVLAFIPLICGVTGFNGDQNLPCMLSSASSFPCGCHSLIRGRICTLLVGVGTPHLSELHCEVGGIAVLPLGEEPPTIPPLELSVRDCALLCHWSPIAQGHTVHCFNTALSPTSTMEKLTICSSVLQALFLTRQPVWTHWTRD